MSHIELTVDGTVVQVRPGATLLEAADAADVRVPRLCHVPGVQSRAVCRLCMVQVGDRTVAACATPALAGMEVRTDTANIAEIRRAVMALTFAEHGGPCGASDCDVCQLARDVGLTTADFRPPDATGDVDDSSDYMQLEHALCVHCDRCITACRDRATLDHVGRGADKRIAFDGGAAAESTCVVCGDCIAACPAGALTSTAARVHAEDPPLHEVVPDPDVEPAPFAFDSPVGTDDRRPAPSAPVVREPEPEPEPEPEIDDEVPFASTMMAGATYEAPAVSAPPEPAAPSTPEQPATPPAPAREEPAPAREEVVVEAVPAPAAEVVPPPAMVEPPEDEVVTEGPVVDRRWKSLLIAAVVVFQLLLPVRYYANDDEFDERFSWRMFSPIRVVRCDVRWTEGAAKRPVKVSADVHFVWTSLMKRARMDVFEGYAKRRCEKLATAKQPQQVYVDLACHHPDGKVRRPIPPGHNLCKGMP